MRYPTRPIAARRIGARRDRLCDRRHIGWALAEKESEHPASAPVADSLRKIVDDRAVKERRSGHAGLWRLCNPLTRPVRYASSARSCAFMLIALPRAELAYLTGRVS